MKANIKYICRTDDAAWRIMDGTAIIVKAKEGEIYALNRVGSLVWKLADGSKNKEDMVQEICSRFDVSEEQASKDLDAFLQEMDSKKLLFFQERIGGQ